MSKKPQVLVTGGMGYIGSHTVVELQDKGFEVVIADDLSNSQIEVLNEIAQITGKRPIFVQLDLCDQEKSRDLFREFKDLWGVIHFAAFKAVGESVRLPLKYFQNNLLSLINVLAGIVDQNIRNFIFSSSATVYGQPDQLPVTEESPIQAANSPYGKTKQICEEIIRDSVSAHNFRAIALRYFNPIGAHDSALIGELPLGIPDNLMPFITQTAIGVREQLKVFGGDYNTPDGSCIRDYIHVVDLAKAHVAALHRLIAMQNKADLEFFNLGTGKGSSVFEVIQSFEKMSGQKLNFQVVERREGDVESIFADTTLANQELKWQAEKTLDDMTLSAWKWEKHYRGKSKLQEPKGDRLTSTKSVPENSPIKSNQPESGRR